MTDGAIDRKIENAKKRKAPQCEQKARNQKLVAIIAEYAEEHEPMRSFQEKDIKTISVRIVPEKPAKM